MNNKIMGISISILVMFLFVSPVLSVSPKKVPVTLVREGFSAMVGPITVIGNTQHCRDMSQGFDSFCIFGDGIELVGYSYGTGDYNINTKTGIGAVKYNINLIFEDGTFVGTIIVHGTFMFLTSPPVPPFMAGFPVLLEGTSHCVAQGTGNYAGWTLTFTTEDGTFTTAEILIP